MFKRFLSSIFFAALVLGQMAFSACFFDKAQAQNIPGLSPTLGNDSGYMFYDSLYSGYDVTLYKVGDGGVLTPATYSLVLRADTVIVDLSGTNRVTGYAYDVNQGQNLYTKYLSSSFNNVPVHVYYDTMKSKITNTGTISETISGLFAGLGSGNAVFNDGEIKAIDALFVGNSVLPSSGYGAAVRNNGVIESITGWFIANSSTQGGGAINNANGGSIKSITATFVDNINSRNSGVNDGGGAIRNDLSTIGSIKGDFIGNKALGSYANYIARGGAILSQKEGAKINSIEGDFIGNHADQTGGAIGNLSGSEIGTIKGNFIDNSADQTGGATENTLGSEIGTIEGNFINNSAGDSGGAIRNHNENTGTSKIGSIVGNFINNYATNSAGAIRNHGKSVIDSIVGNFINNSTGGDAGAIRNGNHALIKNISGGDFISNTSNGEGGAVYNNGDSKILNIETNFYSNKGAYGAAIHNAARSTIEKVKGVFDGNTATIVGGAINNSNSRIYELTGTFTNNNAKENGGAIYNQHGGLINLVAKTQNITFSGNEDGSGLNAIHQRSTSSNGDTTINFNAAEGYSIVVDDPITGDKSVDNTPYTNIIQINPTNSYENSEGETINLPTGGEYVFNNLVSGNRVELYNNATITLGKTQSTYGVLDLRNNDGYTVGFGFQNDENGGVIDMANGHIDNNYLGETTLNSALGLKLDMDVNLISPDGSVDTITLDATKNGTIRIDELNYLSDLRLIGHIHGVKYQVLKNENTSNIVQLALSDELLNKKWQHDVQQTPSADEILHSTSWDKDYYNHLTTTKYFSKLALATSDTTNDSIGFVSAGSESTTTDTMMDDTLRLMANSNLMTLQKQFYTSSATETYVLGKRYEEATGNTVSGIGNVVGGLIVQGHIDGENRSTIDLNNKTGFELQDERSSLMISDLTITNAKDGVATSQDREILLKNVNLIGNKATKGVITSTGKIYIRANGYTSTLDNPDATNGVYVGVGVGSTENTLSLTAEEGGTLLIKDKIDGSFGYKVTLTGDETGTIKLYNDIADGKVSSSGALTVDTADGNLFTYNFNSFVSDENTKYVIDLDVDNQKADLFTTAVDSVSSGYVTLTSINFLGSDFSDLPTTDPTKFVVQVIKNQDKNSTLKLKLGMDIEQPIYKIGTVDETSSDEIISDTSWNKDYFDHKRTDTLYGKLGLVTTTTEDDSIGVAYHHTEKGTVVDTMAGDTLALLAAADIEKKNFMATSADDEYVLGARYEEAVASAYVEGVGRVMGELEVSGVLDGDKRSVLNLNNRKGFEHYEQSCLKFSDIEIINANESVLRAKGVDKGIGFVNTNLKNNVAADGALINAIESPIFIEAHGADSVFENPEAKAAINMIGGSLNLYTSGGGNVLFNDEITGEVFTIAIRNEDRTGEVRFNKNVSGVGLFSILDSNVALGTQAAINTNSMGFSGSDSLLTLDAEVDRENNTVNTGKIYVEDDVFGTLGLIVNSLNGDKLDNDDDAVTPFLFAPNDDPDTKTNISVKRVIGSPYMWEAILNARGEGERGGSTWYLAMRSSGENEVAPEVVAAVGLHEAAIEQTRSLTRNISNKLASERQYCRNCGVYPYNWDAQTLQNVWVSVEGETANMKKPAQIETKLWGIDAGFDVQNDAHNNLGVFVSYKKGDYDLNGKGKKLYAETGSDIDIESYHAGLYYRYDKNNDFVFGSVYAGAQRAVIKTDDGLAKLSTDGVELGAALEVGRIVPITKNTTLTPSVGLYYTQINFDSTHDNVGKRYDWKTIRHFEAEVGVELAQDFGVGNVYIKPSVIQNLTGNDKVSITGLDEQKTYYDNTLGRVEVGGRYGITERLSGYINGKYTFGSGYDALSGMLGLSYRF